MSTVPASKSSGNEARARGAVGSSALRDGEVVPHPTQAARIKIVDKILISV
jgi:hypothetical protein